jgi:hypothetical protein
LRERFRRPLPRRGCDDRSGDAGFRHDLGGDIVVVIIVVLVIADGRVQVGGERRGRCKRCGVLAEDLFRGAQGDARQAAADRKRDLVDVRFVQQREDRFERAALILRAVRVGADGDRDALFFALRRRRRWTARYFAAFASSSAKYL